MGQRTPRGFPVHARGDGVVLSSFIVEQAGSGTYQRPQVDDPGHAWVVVRARGAGAGAGGGTANLGGGAGAGGAFNERCFPYLEVPLGIPWEVGAGGIGSTSTGTDGGTSAVTVGDTVVMALGGAGGTQNSGGDAAGGSPAFTENAALTALSFSPYDGGLGGDGAPNSSTNGTSGGSSVWGGGGGGGAYGGGAPSQPGAGGNSIYGGSGGIGSDGTADGGNGEVPGGGGGGGMFAYAGGDGADGSIEIYVVTWPYTSVFSNLL